jgi:hypothetical protein
MKLLYGKSRRVRSGFERQLFGVRITAIVWTSVIGLALGSLPAFAQLGSPHGGIDTASGASGVPDVPAGAASIRGRVVHETNPAAVAGVPIVLYSLSPDGSPGLRGMVSGDDGAFAFEQVAADASIVYLVGARYREVPFGVRMSFDPGETDRDVELNIGDPTTESTDARVAEVLIRVDQGCDGLLVRESHSLENTGDFVIYVPESERSGRAPILQIPVPAGATHLESTVGDSLDWDGKTISYWGPLRPGRESLEFAYGLPAVDGAVELKHSFPGGVGRVRAFSHARGAVLRPPAGDGRLVPGEPLVLDGASYSLLESGALPAGATLALRAELSAAVTASKQIVSEESRIWLDLDGAALTVDEQHHLSVLGNEPLISASGAPLLCFELDPKAEQLQFSNNTLALGLARDPSGALAVRGPIPAGPTTFSIRYRIPATSDAVPFVREFPFEVPLLSFLVADTGLIVETKDLHRRRPVRTEDRKYLHLEAFGVDPGAKVGISVEPIALRRPMTQWASVGIAVAAGLFAIGFLTVPLRDAAGKTSEPIPTHYAEERESVLASLRSLEDDFETGKLTEVDYQDLRHQLRATAVSLLSQERTKASKQEEAPASDGQAPSCASCGAGQAPDAIFCSRCGTRISGESPSAANSE